MKNGYEAVWGYFSEEQPKQILFLKPSSIIWAIDQLCEWLCLVAMIKSIDAIIDIINSKKIKYIIDILNILDILDIIDPIEIIIICISDNIYIIDTAYILDIIETNIDHQQGGDHWRCQWRQWIWL